jgi:hypothetical protein
MISVIMIICPDMISVLVNFCLKMITINMECNLWRTFLS